MSEPPRVVLFGENRTPIWGMSVDERVRRIARAARLDFAEDGNGGGPALLVDRRFVFDPAWLRDLAARPGEALTLRGETVIAHCRDGAERLAAVSGEGATLRATAYEAGGTVLNAALRKREQPFAMRLAPDTVRACERASYLGAYKGVTDLLTKYLWPEWALVLTRLAARAGISPNFVTAVGALLCVAAAVAFWYGQYWPGMALGLGFMVLDTVDGKLARCTITSSALGNLFDHGIDLVHPPFWWWAWAVGLAAYGRPLAPGAFAWVLATIVVGYVVQRLIEGVFVRRFGMHIHVWRKLDSDFRLITARRNPNMVILFAATLAGRPDVGLVLVAWWTVISCLFHLVRLLQALAKPRAAVASWLG